MSKPKDFTGKLVKIIGTTASHGIPLNTKVRVKARIAVNAGVGDTWSVDHNGVTKNLYGNDIQVAGYTVDELEKQRVELTTQLSFVNDAMKFLKTNKLSEIDENTIKVFRALEIIEDKKVSKIEKAQQIATLID